MADQLAQKGHPKGLWVLFGTEMWERFNYYGMRAILVLFMTKALLFDKVFASNLYGSYTSLVYSLRKLYQPCIFNSTYWWVYCR